MKAGNMDIGGIEAEADREVSIFSQHLRRMHRLVAADAEFLEEVQALISGLSIRKKDHFSRLRSAGVLKGTSTAEARFRCGLYERHFTRMFA